jgi:hypothetical protein
MAYDAAESHTLKVGVDIIEVDNNMSLTAGTQAADLWALFLTPLELPVGDYTPSHINYVHRIAFGDAAQTISRAYVVLYSATADADPTDDGALTRVAMWNIGALAGATGVVAADLYVEVDGDIPSPTAFTIEAGKDYYIGTADFAAIVGTDDFLIYGIRVDGSTDVGVRMCFLSSSPTPPASSTGHESSGRTDRPCFTISLTTPEYTFVLSDGETDTAELSLPVIDGKDYWIFLDAVTVADGASLKFALYHSSAADSSEEEIGSVELDFKATNEINVDDGSEFAQAVDFTDGDVYRIGINVRADGSLDVFYKNLTTGRGDEGVADFITQSHAAGFATNRTWDGGGDTVEDNEYAVVAPYWLKMTGTGTVGAITVAVKPVVLLGDSNSGPGVNRLGGHIGTAFTQDRYVWNESLPGNVLARLQTGVYSTGQLRYEHGTPGHGDLCEMTGMLLVLAGFGVGEFIETPDQAEKDAYTDAVDAVIERHKTQQNNGILIANPASTDSVQGEQDALAEVNLVMAAIAVARGSSFYDPYPITLAKGAHYNDGVHYTAAGAAFVAETAVAVYEGRWPVVTGKRRRSTRGPGRRWW